MAKKKFDARVEDEKKEGFDTVQTDLPSGRFQESKQVLKPEEMGVGTDTPKDSLSVTGDNVASKAKVVKSKMKVAPDVSVEQLEGKQVGGVPLAAGQALRSVAGVSNQSVADDRSKIPYTAGNYRPETRYGKKRSEELFEMDNTITEQVVPIVDDAPDLKEAPEAGIGYNGRKQFKQTRSKKNFTFRTHENHSNGKIPQQLLNDASVDFVETEKLLYTSGQMIENEIENQANYPTVNAEGQQIAVPLRKSNYLLTSMDITVDDGHITSIRFNEHKYEVKADPLVRDQANFNAQVDANNVAKTMIKIQTELGRETTEKWTPLAYVVNQPYEVNMLYHDIEATTGAIAAAAYRSAVSSMAWQKNILSKDGINPQRNAIKMIVEGYAGEFTNSSINSMDDTSFAHMIWNQNEYQKGSPAALIAMFDSVNKYRTKADLLGMQRSFGMHLAQADNNLNPLHCKPEFIKAMDKAHMFSTIDGNYNPMLPIFSTKGFKIVNPLSLNYFTMGWKNPALFTADDRLDNNRDQETGTYAQCTYQYNDIRNIYKTRIQHPIVEGLIRWLLKHEGAFVHTFGEGDINIPCFFNLQNPSLFSFMICSALQDIVYERNICFRDILFAGDQYQYIWDDLQGLDKLNPLYSSQLTIGKYDEPLKLGKLAPDTAVRELWGGHMQLTDYSEVSNKVQYIMPWYFNEHAFGNTSGSYTANEGFLNEPSAFNMTFPSIRDGVRHEYVDMIKSMDLNDVRLSLDRLMDIPYFDDTETITGTIPGIVSNYNLWTRHYHNISSADLNAKVKFSALRYEANSDGRLVVTYNLTENENKNLTCHSLYLVPKEIGFIDDLYLGRLIFDGVSYTDSGLDLVNYCVPAADANMSVVGVLNDLHYYQGYSPLTLTSYRVDGDSNTQASIDRSAALSQVFYRCYASPVSDVTTVNNRFVAETGIIPSIGYADGAADTLYGVFNLNSTYESTTALDTRIVSNAARIWSNIQRFFMPVDRFANCFTLTNSNHAYDPFEQSFYFGVCGTLAVDYTQCVLERLDTYDQLGIDYTEDVNIRDSLIFR